MNFTTESLNAFGIYTISFLQQRFPSWARFLLNMSLFGDPALAFTFYFPLCVALSFEVGCSLLWTLILCEWTNMILKWVLAGDRPFWWMHESLYFLHGKLPEVHQFPLTCETGPGMPSGHSTLNAALFFIITDALILFSAPLMTQRLSMKQWWWAKRFIWIAYGVWVFLIMISRVFIATHFPHQCLAGALIGLFIAQLVVRYPGFFKVSSRKQTFLLTASILGSIFGVFSIYKILGNDPMWSVGKAIRWCVRREYIHIDSKPFYSLSRFSGLSLGFGLALVSSQYKKIQQPKFSWKMKASLAILTVGTGQTVHFIHGLLPHTVTAYYLIEFIINAFYVYMVIALLPSIVLSASGVKSKPKIKIKKDKKK